MKKVNWVFVILVLIAFLNYGQTFGLSSPIELDLGFIIFTFGLKIQITIASVIGVIISLIVYKFIR